jgi:hypothetical protein
LSEGIRFVYIIDASSLVDLHRLFPPDIFTGLWGRLDLIIHEGRLIAPHEVKREIDVRDDDASKWLSEHQEMVTPTTVEIVHEVTDIIARSRFIADEKKEKPVADPFLIAQVLVERKQKRFDQTDFFIVTEERGTNSPITDNSLKNLKKIPDLCKYYDIPCLNLIGFFRQEEWKF